MGEGCEEDGEGESAFNVIHHLRKKTSSWMKNDWLKLRNHLDEFAATEQFFLIEGIQ